MTKEDAITKLLSMERKQEALENCIKILDVWQTTRDLTAPLKKRWEEIDAESEKLYEIVTGEKSDINKVR